MSTPKDPDFPEPGEGSETIYRAVQEIPGEGALLEFDGHGARGHAVESGTFAAVVTRFDRLVKIKRATEAGFSVERSGPLPEPKNAGRTLVGSLAPASLLVPLRIEQEDGQTELVAHEAIGPLVDVLSLDDAHLLEYLRAAPEREGDEWLALMKALAEGEIDLTVMHVQHRAVARKATVTQEDAARRAKQLGFSRESDISRETVIGTLFRIDTKRLLVSIDDADNGGRIVTATFTLAMLEELKQALRTVVRAELDVLEEARPYERTARSRRYSVAAVEVVEAGEGP